MIDICDFAVGFQDNCMDLTMHSERPVIACMSNGIHWELLGLFLHLIFPLPYGAGIAMLAWVCGDVCIWKPSEKTPFVVLPVKHIIAEVFEKNDVPEGVLVYYRRSRIGEWMANDTRIPLVSATGSTRMGKAVGSSRRCKT